MMRRVALFALIAFVVPALLVGCDKKPGDKLVGSWTIDTEAFKASEEYKKAPDEQKKMMEEMMKAMQMDITFTADTIKSSVKMGEETKTDEAKYTIAKTEGDKLVLSSVSKDGTKEEVEVEFQGDKLVMGKGAQKFTLRKK